VNGFLAKAGGKDKLTALIQARPAPRSRKGPPMRRSGHAGPRRSSGRRPDAAVRAQYAAMFVSAGEPGNAKKVQVSVAAARKVFRIFGVRAPRRARPAARPGRAAPTRGHRQPCE